METAEINIETRWNIDPSHSDVSFKIKHLMITNVKGTFKQFGASLNATNENFTNSQIDFWINPSSIDTGDDKRDMHLKSKEFFDVENYRQITFSGKLSEKMNNMKNFDLTGELTIKNISQEVKLSVEYLGAIKDLEGNDKIGFLVYGKINRKDFGLAWNTAIETVGGMLLGDDVLINCEVQLIKQI